MTIEKQIERLVQYGIRTQLIDNQDAHYVRNGLLDLLQVAGPYVGELEESELPQAPEEVVPALLDAAFELGLFPENTTTYRDLWDAKLMGYFVARPSEVNARYAALAAEHPEQATDYFYRLAVDSNYIRMDRIRNNLAWKSPTRYGQLDITINLSKPEKDPREIAAERNAPRSDYPKCLLCSTNVGYAGRVNHPARQNLRVLPVELNSEAWFMQYSPYVYYNEHCIVLHSEHVPMKITEATFARLVDFVKQVPHYFVGSNADLPIVGGSILTHDHFQGGRYSFAMMQAPKRGTFSHATYPEVEVAVVDWPMSVARLSSHDADQLLALAGHVLRTWRGYSDTSNDILAHSVIEGEQTPHNTITPVCFKDAEGRFVLDLVLRNNRTTAERPFGLFHPDESLHHIKKENIGLIEVMGLAVLPGRLADELKQIEAVLRNGQNIDGIESDLEHPLNKHAIWMRELQSQVPAHADDLSAFIQNQVGQKFASVLEACGVFKKNATGDAGWITFIRELGCNSDDTLIN